MNPSTIEILATVFFGIAVIHTFLVKRFEHLAHKYPKGSIPAETFHFLGEVEAVFGMWAAVFILCMEAIKGSEYVIHYLEKDVNFTEPAFVFVIMAMAGTRPVLKFAEKIILIISKMIPVKSAKMQFYVSALIFGPLLGSFITEPAAMTVTAIILLKNFYSKDMSKRFKYATIGLLFVNVSIGGTLTYFAAPPVLMVAQKWGFDQEFWFMLKTFGYKSLISVVVGTVATSMVFAKELQGSFELRADNEEKVAPPWWVTLFHVICLFFVVFHSHHMVAFLGVFLFFLGFTSVTEEYQDAVKLKESLLVGFFLGGLVTLGSQQQFWLQPLISSLGEIPLFIGATGLTAVTDNAALTYLGTLVEGLSDASKYYLVAGAVAGGGLTVIANAPNPAGFGILKKPLEKKGLAL
jgi:hypothetical protein